MYDSLEAASALFATSGFAVHEMSLMFDQFPGRVCPLARAILTHGPGETVEIAGQDAVILEVR
jgi:hypothetical protein